MAAVVATLAWDGDYENEPQGWVRHIGTWRRRPDGTPESEYIAD